MQGDAGIGNLQLQFVPQDSQQFSTAQCRTQLIRVVRMEQDQAGTVHQGMQLSTTAAAGLLQLLAVPLQQCQQPWTGQAVQALQVAQTYGQQGAGRTLLQRGGG